MMKKLLLSFLLSMVLVPQSYADEVQPTAVPVQNDRTGLFLGFNLGMGGMHIDDNTGNNLDDTAFIGGFRAGGGLNENILLMGETMSSSVFRNNTTISTYTFQFSSQLFFKDNFYFRPGVGFAFSNSSTSVGSTTVIVSSDTGFSTVGALGYEFRMGKSFVLSPEAIFNYDRISGSDFYNYGGTLGLLWYFN